VRGASETHLHVAHPGSDHDFRDQGKTGKLRI